jgi:hypothetical protein
MASVWKFIHTLFSALLHCYFYFYLYHCLYHKHETSSNLMLVPPYSQPVQGDCPEVALELGLDTGTRSTRGFGPQVFPGMGMGWHFSTRTISAYPARKPAGFHRSKLWCFGGLNHSEDGGIFDGSTYIYVTFYQWEHILHCVQLWLHLFQMIDRFAAMFGFTSTTFS